MCGGYTTNKITLSRGVRQGCPISMLLFNITINPLLVKIEQINSGGLLIANHRISCLAFADDIALIAPNCVGIQDQIDASCIIAKQLGFKFKPSKCGNMQGGHPRDNTRISIYDTFIPNMEIYESYRYLGVNFSNNMHHDPSQLFHEMIELMEKIQKSILLPWQKIHAYLVFIHSKSIFYLKNYFISIKSMDKVDFAIRKQLKLILGVPKNCSNSYLYTPRNKGGCGLKCIRDEYIIQTITHAFRMLTCKDKIISEIAKLSLISSAKADNKNKSHFTLVESLSWLNTACKNTRGNSWWDKIREVIRLGREQHNTIIKFVINDEFLININLISLLPSNRSALVTFKDSNKLSKLTRHFFLDSYRSKWSKQKSQGRYEPVRGSNYSNDIVFSGHISINQFKFIHSARTDTLRIRCRQWIDDKMCRKCHTELETQQHVFTQCSTSRGLVTSRHNGVLKIIENNILRHTKCKVNTDKPCVYTNSPLRVDLQIEDKLNKKIFLIDIKCPMDVTANIERAHNNNMDKYSALRDHIAEIMPGWKIILNTFIVACFGSWVPENNKILYDLGFRKNNIKDIAHECVKSNIKWSCEQWRFHQGMISDHEITSSNIDNIHFNYYKDNFYGSDCESDDGLDILFETAKEDGLVPFACEND